MRFMTIAFFMLILLVTAGMAGAQNAAKGWLGVEVANVAKEETAWLGLGEPHGARVKNVINGSPADKAGLHRDDVIIALDNTLIETAAEFVDAARNNAPGATVKLRLLRGGKDHTLTATLAQWPLKPTPAADAPLLMLDTGGHMSKITDVVFTPDGKRLISASTDKTIRVWDVATGKSVRTILGESWPGASGEINAIALSPDGARLAVGGRLGKSDTSDYAEVIRLYDFATGHLVALLKDGHGKSVTSLAFSPDGRRLISGSNDNTAIIWDTEEQRLLHRLRGHGDTVFAVGFTPDGERAVTGSFDKDLRLWRAGDKPRRRSGWNDRLRRSIGRNPAMGRANGGFP
jgi:WD40 repeat protein